MELSRYGCMYAHVTWMFGKCTHQDLQSRGEQQQEEEDQLLLFLQVNKQYILCTQISILCRYYLKHQLIDHHHPHGNNH